MPEWFLELAEAIGGRRLDEDGVPVDISIKDSKRIRGSALARGGDGIGVDLARDLLLPREKKLGE